MLTSNKRGLYVTLAARIVDLLYILYRFMARMASLSISTMATTEA